MSNWFLILNLTSHGHIMTGFLLSLINGPCPGFSPHSSNKHSEDIMLNYS